MKTTGGGTFQRADEHLYFLATSSSHTEEVVKVHRNILIGVEQINTRTTAMIQDLGRAGVKVFLDSGIFALTNAHMRAHNVTMDEALALAPEAIDGFDELYARYVGAVTALEPYLWGYNELDQGGAANKRRTRAGLEQAGLRAIPVYHPINDGWDYFDELIAEYDRLCVGNLVQASAPVRLRIIATIADRVARSPYRPWIHFLGVTPSSLVMAYPQASADSSSWCGASRAWQGWLREFAAATVMGSLSEDAVGGAAVLAHGTDSTFPKKLVMLAAYIGNGVERNWQTLERDRGGYDG